MDEPSCRRQERVAAQLEIKTLCGCPDYVGVVAAWIYDEFAEKESGAMTLEKVEAYFRHTYKDKLPVTLVALVDGECIGTVSLFSNDLKNQQILSPWLASLYVNEIYRGRGVAQKLIEKVKEISLALGFATLYLRTEHAAQYYRKLNWLSQGKTHDEKGKETEVFMFALKS